MSLVRRPWFVGAPAKSGVISNGATVTTLALDARSVRLRQEELVDSPAKRSAASIQVQNSKRYRTLGEWDFWHWSSSWFVCQSPQLNPSSILMPALGNPELSGTK